jgi:hypothetical protein
MVLSAPTIVKVPVSVFAVTETRFTVVIRLLLPTPEFSANLAIGTEFNAVVIKVLSPAGPPIGQSQIYPLPSAPIITYKKIFVKTNALIQK